MPTKKPEDFLTPREVAGQLRVPYTTVLNSIAAGEFPNAINVGSEGNGARYRLTQADVARWVESRKVIAA